MKREIKFRAWDAINKEMKHPRKKDVFATGPTSGEFVDNWDNVMQFTGLTDKNGKEIYEGDVVSYGYKTSVVIWKGEGFCTASVTEKCIEQEYEGQNPYQAFMIGGHPVEIDTVVLHNIGSCEVIGNIYENPELLK